MICGIYGRINFANDAVTQVVFMASAALQARISVLLLLRLFWYLSETTAAH
jgi:hypothetical protein